MGSTTGSPPEFEAYFRNDLAATIKLVQEALLYRFLDGAEMVRAAAEPSPQRSLERLSCAMRGG